MSKVKPWDYNWEFLVMKTGGQKCLSVPHFLKA
jgi:hypothetical protein